MNLSEMRTLVRRDLHDEDAANYRWSNDEIERHIARSVKEFSEAIPLEQLVTLATTSGSREISVAALTDRIMLEAIEYPTGKFPQQYRRFSLWGDTLTLLDDIIPDGSDCRIYYGKIHTLNAGSSTIPAQYEDLVATGAAGYAALEWAVYAVNRINTGGRQSPDSFLTWGKANLALFKAELKRLGRRNRARIRTLYQPSSPLVSQTTDYGP